MLLPQKKCECPQKYEKRIVIKSLQSVFLLVRAPPCLVPFSFRNALECLLIPAEISREKQTTSSLTAVARKIGTQIRLRLINYTLTWQYSAVHKLKFPRHSRLCAVPDLLAGVFTVILVCIPRKGAVLLTQSRNTPCICLPLENIASSFSETRLVSRDVRFP